MLLTNLSLFTAEGGSSSDECSLFYHGAGPGSEPEVQAVQNEAQKLKGNLKVWLTYHTVYYAYLTPYGNENEDGTCEIPLNYVSMVSKIFFI